MRNLPRRITAEPTREPLWYVVWNLRRAVIEAHQLQPDVDLKRVLVAAMLEPKRRAERLKRQETGD
jgi:hypothetical protein